MRRHHGRRWTTSTAATLALVLILALTVITAFVAAAALSTTVIAGAVAALALRATGAWAWAVVSATRGKWVIGHAAGSAGLRHRSRHGVAWGRALARLLGIALTRVLAWLRCTLARLWRWLSSGSAWLWCCLTWLGGSLSGPCAGLRRSVGWLRCLCTWLRGAGLRRSGFRAALCTLTWLRRRRCRLLGVALAGLSGLGSLLSFVCLAFGGIATGLCFIVSTHLLDHRWFDGRGCGFNELALFLQGGEQFLAGYSELFCQLVNT